MRQRDTGSRSCEPSGSGAVCRRTPLLYFNTGLYASPVQNAQFFMLKIYEYKRFESVHTLASEGTGVYNESITIVY